MLEIAPVRWHCESISEIGGFADDKCAPLYLSGAMSTSVVMSKKATVLSSSAIAIRFATVSRLAAIAVIYASRSTISPATRKLKSVDAVSISLAADIYRDTV
jgi:hypothetical protein